MEYWIQAVPTITLIAALLVAISYVLRHWPDSHDKLARELRRLTNTIDSAVPGLTNDLGRIRRRLVNEISRLFPLWSAATTENREAEFIHDPLRDRVPFWVVAVAIVVVVSLAWSFFGR